MAEPKKPQDHKAKKPTVKAVAGGQRVTFPSLVEKASDGKTVMRDEKPAPLAVTVADEALNDFELLDDLRAVDVDQNASRLPALLRRMVGDDFKKVMDALRDPETKRVPIQAATDWLRSLMEALNPNS